MKKSTCAACPYSKMCVYLNQILTLKDESKKALSSGDLRRFHSLALEISEKMAQIDGLQQAGFPGGRETPGENLTPPQRDFPEHKKCLESIIKTILSKNQEQEVLVRAYMSSVLAEINAVRQLRLAGLHYKAQTRKASLFDSLF